MKSTIVALAAYTGMAIVSAVTATAALTLTATGAHAATTPTKAKIDPVIHCVQPARDYVASPEVELVIDNSKGAKARVAIIHVQERSIETGGYVDTARKVTVAAHTITYLGKTNAHKARAYKPATKRAKAVTGITNGRGIFLQGDSAAYVSVTDAAYPRVAQAKATFTLGATSSCWD